MINGNGSVAAERVVPLADSVDWLEKRIDNIADDTNRLTEVSIPRLEGRIEALITDIADLRTSIEQFGVLLHSALGVFVKGTE